MEENDFETYVRNTLSTLCQDVKEIKESQAKIQNDLQQFYNQVLSNSNDVKKMWDNINIIINKKRPNSHIEKLYADDKYYQQPQSIANILNSYFCNIPSSLASKLPKTNIKNASYLPRKTSKFKFSRVSELEVFLSLENLNTKQSFGADKVHPLLVSIAIF